MNSSGKTDPRYVSLLILNEYFIKRTSLKNLINNYLDKNPLSDLDRRFLFEIVKGTVRFLLKIDYLIGVFSDIKIEKMEPGILNLLREAVYQLLYMNRIPAYSCVDESVKISRIVSGQRASGFVNAVLRKISSVKNLKDFTDSRIMDAFPGYSERLSLLNSFPLWLVNYWIEIYGRKTTGLICESLNREPVYTLMVCRNRISKKDLLRILQKNFKCPGENIFSMDRSVNKAKLFENCIFIKNLQGLYDLDAFRDGYFSIQDFTSQIPVKFFLNPQKGERILDLCGAPGGKAALMSEATSGSCEIISIDISTERLNLFKENIRRLGLKNIFLLKADAGRNGYLDDYMKNNKKTGSFIDYFDKVFVDAPCSSFGTISKNPDVKYNRDFNDLRSYSERSLKIISSSARYVKPGGIIVFYTCTLSSIENQDMIRKFAGRNSLNLRLRNVSAPRIMKKYLEEKKVNLPNCSNDYFEVLPYFFNSEAGFMAVLEKKIH